MQQSIIRELKNTEIEDEKKKEVQKSKIRDNARKAEESARVGAILKARQLNISSVNDVKQTTLNRQLILAEGHRAELEMLGISEKEKTALLAQEQLIKNELLAQQQLMSDEQKLAFL